MISRRLFALLVIAALPATLASAATSGAWTVNGPPGASVHAISPSPSSPATVYVGTGRGVWKGQRGGEAWQDASTGLPPERVQAVAVDPSNPNVVYAGTITPFGVPSVGLFKSTDGGVSWADANNGLFDPFTLISPLDVPSISVDPSNPQVVVAGTRFSEIYRTADGGETWTPQTIGGAGLNLETTGLARDPANPQRIYAASTIGMLLSVDGGVNWDTFGNAGISFYSVAVDPSAPATVWAGNAFGFGVAKSLDSGATWQSANGNLPHATAGGVDFFPAINSVAIAPDGSAVYVATTAGLFRSTDGGTNWTGMQSGLNETDFDSIAFLPGQPASTVLAGGDAGGVYRTTDAGASWSSSPGLNEALIADVVTNPGFAGFAYAAAPDGVYATSNGGSSWTRASGGLPVVPVAALAFRFAVSIQPGDEQTLFAGTLGESLWATVDGGASWSLRNSGLDDQYVSAVAVAPSDATRLYAGTNHPNATAQRVYKSSDSGQTWTRTGLDAGSNFSIDVIVIDPNDASRVAALSHGAAGYFQTENGGIAWRTINPGAGCGAIHAVAYEAGSDAVLVGSVGGVCRSENGGTTWNHYDIAPLSVIEDLLFDPQDASVVYAAAAPAVPGGLGGGVYQSTDGGRTWTVLGAGQETDSVRSLALDAGGQRLYAGIFRGSVATMAFGEPVRETPEPPTPSDRETRVIERP